MANELQKELWLLEDEYIDRRVAGEDIDIGDYCNRPYLTNEEKQELRERLRLYEISQKGLESYVKNNIDSDAVWKRISARISEEKVMRISDRISEEEVIKIPQRLKAVAEDSSHEEELKSRIMHEFTNKVILLKDYTGELLYRNMHSASLVFREGEDITRKLDGCIIDFYVGDQDKESKQIEDGSAVIDFGVLGISIKDHSKVRFTIRKGDEIICQGSLGDE